jgi:hypothetical protein
METSRNFLIQNVELNWARLDKPVAPFGTEQYELQIATTDKGIAGDWSKNHLNVKEKDGKFVVSLKRKATRADGSSNGEPRVVNADKTPYDFSKQGLIGNGSIGNVIVYQYPYEVMGRKGIGSSLTAVQIVEHKELSQSVDFDIVGSDEPQFDDSDSSDELF